MILCAMRWALLSLLLLTLPGPARAQEEYGAKGIYPVYETGGQWLIFDKHPKKDLHPTAAPPALCHRFLVIGSEGSEIFQGRELGDHGGARRGKRPAKLRAALLKGPRSAVGRPIIGIKVPASFRLKGSRAKYVKLSNQTGEGTYAALGEAIKKTAIDDVAKGAFRFKLEDEAGALFQQNPALEKVQMKIDFGAQVVVKGLSDPFLFVESTQISSTYRRCLRLADGGKLRGDCALMPHDLMAETNLLQFVSYDPSGQGNPYLLAFTPAQPLWGHERASWLVATAPACS